MSRKRIASKKQRIPQRIKPLVVILGDGETEKDYVERLKDLEYFENVNLKYEKGNEENFEIKLKEHLYIEENVLVFLDIDNENKSSCRYHKIKYLIEKYKKQVFYNNYAFETWLINHKKTFHKPIVDKKEYNQDIKALFDVNSWSKYKNKENRTKIMNQIEKDDVDKACENIKVISGKDWDNNPSSNMDKMVKKIKKIKP